MPNITSEKTGLLGFWTKNAISSINLVSEVVDPEYWYFKEPHQTFE